MRVSGQYRMVWRITGDGKDFNAEGAEDEVMAVAGQADMSLSGVMG